MADEAQQLLRSPQKRPASKLTKEELLMWDKNEHLLDNLNSTRFCNFIEDSGYVSDKGKIDWDVLVTVVNDARWVCEETPRNRRGAVRKLLRLLTRADCLFISHCMDALTEGFERSLFRNKLSFFKDFLAVLIHVMKHRLEYVKKIQTESYPKLQNLINSDASFKKPSNDISEAFEQFQRHVRRIDNDIQFVEEDVDEAELWRNLSIVPRTEDIVNYIVSSLPKNIIDRPYHSVNHYLSTHYRLMREDMVRSFRKCAEICMYNDPIEMQKCGYKHFTGTVSFPPQYTTRGICYKTTITSEKEIVWVKKDVLMPGNIVCLTPDNFNSIHFAIINSDPRVSTGSSKTCTIELRIIDERFEHVLKPGIPYEVFESDAYFECYRHVLDGIKKFDVNSLPFSDVLVHLDFTDMVPEYLSNPKDEKVLMYSLDTEEPKKFNPLFIEDWPTAEELGLDSFQLEAFQLALTKKVAIIQGPPGTGKTFLGNKVVKALLDNARLRKPIVICCMTNHALDQFLGKIIKYTNAVVRMGSQSTDSNIEPYTIDNLKLAYSYQLEQETHPMQFGADTHLDKTAKKSIEILLSFAGELTKKGAGRLGTEMAEGVKEMKDICDGLNRKLGTYNDCDLYYLDDQSLTVIIPQKYKDQLAAKTKDRAISKSLRSNLFEWLGKKRKAELEDECKRHFKKFDSAKNINPPNPADIWHLQMTDRYALFYCWRREYLEKLKKDIESGQNHYSRKMSNLSNEVIDNAKQKILQYAQVIGVTTTGAAKFKDYLYYAEPEIMIVEEAAEVLESHIIASLLPSVKHLIMIGDHKQLRPIPADIELSEHYNLKFSMFERLYNNEAPSVTLVTQHRMRPCFADLLVQPELYSQLEHSQSVCEYKEMKGIKSMFFFNHLMYERQSSTSNSTSNEKEAKFIVNVAMYICSLGYEPENMVILATYAAQVTVLQTELHSLNVEIQVTTVDNFQGEERDIVLVSFVRNNPNGFIGFLKENNRVCVALSRAKKGLFCAGNFTMYASKSKLWKNIVSKLEEQGCIDKVLPLTCPRHATLVAITTAEEIKEFISRGCPKMCGFELSCGHLCERRCHLDNPEHIGHKCRSPCEKFYKEGKQCPKLCYERCKAPKKSLVDLPCGHQSRYPNVPCMEEMPKFLPCGHKVTIPCSTDESTYLCTGLIYKMLSCGHRKNVPCSKSNISHQFIQCMELISVQSPCGHAVQMPCNQFEMDDIDVQQFCTMACDELLDCGHPCNERCGVCKELKIHGFCWAPCEKLLDCGHKCVYYCSAPCAACKKKCVMQCSHGNKCDNSCYRPCMRCKEPCDRHCSHVKCERGCSEECSVPPCQKACEEILECGHKCLGLCGQPCPYLCGICHKDDFKSGDPKRDRYVCLIDCDCIVELESLTEHIETNCLLCCEWPYCPECKEPIAQTMLFKSHLAKARQSLLARHTSTENKAHLRYLFDALLKDSDEKDFGFYEINNTIQTILDNKKISASELDVLKECILILLKMQQIQRNNEEKRKKNPNQDLQEDSFMRLLQWVANHLERASYQQLREAHKATKKLADASGIKYYTLEFPMDGRA